MQSLAAKSSCQRLIRRAVALEPDNDGKLDGLAEAQASAAKELARLDGMAADSPEEADRMAVARSQILRDAIEHRIAAATPDRAVTLYDRIKDRLSPADRDALALSIGNATNDAVTDAWLARETAVKDGPPLADRIGPDAGLSDLQRLILRAKIAARDSAEQSHRVATVKGIDDQLAAASATLATQPARYRPGTLSRLADAYADAGAPEQADATRRLARQEHIFRTFSRAGAAMQQRHLDDFTGPERALAETIMRQQQAAFAADPYAAGTALYPNVGPPLPEDAEGRLRQVRMIEAMRGTSFPSSTAAEATTTPVTGSQEGFLQDHAIWTDGASPAIKPRLDGTQRVEATPDDFQPMPSDIAPGNEHPRAGTAWVEPTHDSEAYRVADADVRRRQEVEAIDTDRMITDWMARASQPDYQPRNIPPSLEKRLSPEQKEAIDRIMSAKQHKLEGLTDPGLYTEIRNGLTSSDANERGRWAIKPLYQHRLSLSPADFARLAALQSTISPGTGYLRTGEVGHPVGSPEDHAKVALTLATFLEGLPAWALPLLRSMTAEPIPLEKFLKERIRQRSPQKPRFTPDKRGTYSPPNTEPLPGDREYRDAEEDLRQLQAEDRNQGR